MRKPSVVERIGSRGVRLSTGWGALHRHGNRSLKEAAGEGQVHLLRHSVSAYYSLLGKVHGEAVEDVWVNWERRTKRPSVVSLRAFPYFAN